MDLKEQKKTGVVVLALTGRLDATTSGKLEETLLGLIERGETKLALNFHRLDYISSAGLRVLLVAAKRLKPLNGKLVLYSVNPQVREVFEIAGFTSIFPISATEEDALKSVQK
jgi:anti-anti-sigma factor